MIPPNALQALEMSRDLPATPNNIARVSRTLGDEAARWAFGQWDLRKRAKAKFTRTDEMLFVREALEQATHERVAAYHASLFPQGALVADLTTGIGADLIALAQRGPAIGFELDSERAEYARHNLGNLAATVHIQDSLAADIEATYAFADPARRVEGRRTLNLDEFSPAPREIADRFANLTLGVIKLTPMLRDEDLESLGKGLEFISFGGECREALVLAGRDAPTGRWAVHVETGERLPAHDPIENTETPGAYLFDADPAAIRAHALGALGLATLGDSNGYLTGDDLLPSPWLRPYRVLYHGKADAKTTRAALRDLDAATPELKQRGAGLDLIKERKTYAMNGKRPLSLAIWPVGRSLRHTILEAM